MTGRRLAVERYTEAFRDQWDDLVEASPTGTIQQTRRFLDYHGERFDDFSLVVTEQRSGRPRTIAVLPLARTSADRAVSHPGAAHGGLVARTPLGIERTVAALESIESFLVRIGLTSIQYRPSPATFHSVTCEDDTAALALLGASVCSRVPNTVVDTRVTELGRERNRRFARRAGCTSSETQDSTGIHILLCETLDRRHRVRPVHTNEQLLDLKKRFPHDVRFFETYHEEKLVAGVITFQLNRATHIQYMCSSPEGFIVRALDNTIELVAQEMPAHSCYLSLGISTSPDGLELNPGLARFKEKFGGTTHCIDRIDWQLRR